MYRGGTEYGLFLRATNTTRTMTEDSTSQSRPRFRKCTSTIPFKYIYACNRTNLHHRAKAHIEIVSSVVIVSNVKSLIQPTGRTSANLVVDVESLDRG